jgi:TolA-binding protein
VSKRFTLLFFVLLALAIAVPSFAAPMPSKTAANQSLDSRSADLAVVRDFTSNEQVSQALAARGFTPDQVNSRVAQLSPQDLHQLANNLDQLNAAGLTRQEWIWVGIGALAALILVIALG